MRMMTMKKYFPLGLAVVFAGAMVLASSTMTSAQQLLYILSSDQQSFGETLTSSTTGEVKYTKSFFNPGQMIYVTFNAQGDTHGGAALEMACHYNGVPCEQGSGAAEGGQWSTLNKLPAADSGASNCSDGGGGAGDCHDNTIHKVWCVKAGPGPATVDLLLKSSNGGTVFYERSTILIEGSRGSSNLNCQAPAAEPITYNVTPQSASGVTLSGSFTTDGTLGFLSPSNVTSSSVVITQGSTVYPLGLPTSGPSCHFEFAFATPTSITIPGGAMDWCPRQIVDGSFAGIRISESGSDPGTIYFYGGGGLIAIGEALMPFATVGSQPPQIDSVSTTSARLAGR